MENKDAKDLFILKLFSNRFKFFPFWNLIVIYVLNQSSRRKKFISVHGFVGFKSVAILFQNIYFYLLWQTSQRELTSIKFPVLSTAGLSFVFLPQSLLTNQSIFNLMITGCLLKYTPKLTTTVASQRCSYIIN